MTIPTAAIDPVPIPQQPAISDEIARRTRRGWRVESQTATHAVLVKGHRHNHLLHLILTVLTAGVWGLLVWLPLAVFGGEKRRIVEVDASGRVTVKRARA